MRFAFPSIFNGLLIFRDGKNFKNFPIPLRVPRYVVLGKEEMIIFSCLPVEAGEALVINSLTFFTTYANVTFSEHLQEYIFVILHVFILYYYHQNQDRNVFSLVFSCRLGMSYVETKWNIEDELEKLCVNFS